LTAMVRLNIHGQNGGTTADIENNLVLKEVLVLHNRVHIRSGTDLIFLHVSSLSDLAVLDATWGQDAAGEG
jgi:hypothetical protein